MDTPRTETGAKTQPDAERDEALQTLQAIRGYLEAGDEHSRRTTALPAASAFLAGSLAAAGATALELGVLPLPAATAFLVVWGVVFGLAFLGSLGIAELGARRRGLPVLSRLARRITIALLPAFAGAAVATVAIIAGGEASALPAVWMAFYGTGLLTFSGWSWRPLSLVAAAFLSAAAASAVAPEAGRNIVMGLAFGGIHLAYAVSLLFRGSDPWDELVRLSES